MRDQGPGEGDHGVADGGWMRMQSSNAIVRAQHGELAAEPVHQLAAA
ncbi:hypothetical protein ACU635_32040 [[Actinomadura] parvosata]